MMMEIDHVKFTEYSLNTSILIDETYQLIKKQFLKETGKLDKTKIKRRASEHTNQRTHIQVQITNSKIERCYKDVIMGFISIKIIRYIMKICVAIT